MVVSAKRARVVWLGAVKSADPTMAVLFIQCDMEILSWHPWKSHVGDGRVGARRLPDQSFRGFGKIPRKTPIKIEIVQASTLGARREVHPDAEKRLTLRP